MKKKALVPVIAGVVVVAAAAGAPYWFGLQAEKQYERMAQELAQRSGATLTTLGYERGWLTSSANMTLSTPGMPLVFAVQHRIIHGPLPVARWLGGSLDFTPVEAIIESEVTLQSDTKLGVPLPPLNVVTTIDLTGHTTARYTMAALHTSLSNRPSKVPFPSDAKLDFAGIEGSAVVADDHRGLRLHLTAPLLSISNGPIGTDLRGITFDSDTQEGPAGYPLGNSSVSIDRIAFGNAAVVQGLRFSSNTRAQGNDVTVGFQQTVRTAKVAGTDYGPMQVDFALRKLDAAIMMRFNKLAENIQKQKLPPQQAGMAMAGEALKLVAALAKKAPELELTKLSLKVPGGEVTGHGKLVLDGSQVDIAQNPFAIMTALNGDAALSLPAGVVENVVRARLRQEVEALKTNGTLSAEEASRLNEQKVAAIVDQALPGRLQQVLQRAPLVRNDGGYEIKASLHGGRMLVNDQPWQPNAGGTVVHAR